MFYNLPAIASHPTFSRWGMASQDQPRVSRVCGLSRHARRGTDEPSRRGAERFACTGIRGLQLLVIDNGETNVVEQTEPAARGQGELDAARIARHLPPVDAVKTEPVSYQSLGCGRAVQRAAGQCQRMVTEERQNAASAQQPVRLRNPDKGVAPDRGAVFGHGKVVRAIGPRHLLCVAVNPGDV